MHPTTIDRGDKLWNKWKKFALVISCLLGQLASVEARQFSKCLVLTEVNNNETISVKTGEMICLKLSVLPATGYMWYASDVGSGLRQVGASRFEPVVSGQGKPGATEAQTFRFSARKPGLYEIHLMYGRPQNVLKKLTFTLNVR